MHSKPTAQGTYVFLHQNMYCRSDELYKYQLKVTNVLSRLLCTIKYVSCPQDYSLYYTWVQPHSSHTCLRATHIERYAGTYISTHTRTHAHVRTHTCTYAHTHARSHTLYMYMGMNTPPEVILCEAASEEDSQSVADLLLSLLLHVPLLQSVEQSWHHVHRDHHLSVARLLPARMSGQRGRRAEEGSEG